MVKDELEALVEHKLATHGEDRRPWPEEGFEWPISEREFRELVEWTVAWKRRGGPVLDDDHDDVRFDFLVHMRVSWRGLRDEDRGTEAHERRLAGGAHIAMQRYREHVTSSETWRRELAAGERGDRWLALGAAYEAAGRQLQASAALAAARWLDPTTASASAAIERARDPDAFPPALRGQLQPGFRDLPLLHRHWEAWAMKLSGRLDVPSMIAYACDESFWVRGALYRSLGLQPYLAVAPVLRDGLSDPHPFARSRAAEALGWTVSPTALEPLQQLARDDPSSGVRWAAELAVQQIVGYWLYYGEWEAILYDGDRRDHVARELTARGLGRFAIDVRDRPRREAGAPPDPTDEPSVRFRGTAPEVAEAAILGADPVTEPDDMLALYAVSKHRRNAERALALASAPGALGWNARRALRALRLR